MFNHKLTPVEIKLKNNLFQQMVSCNLDDVKPIKISFEQMTNFRNAVKQILIEEKVPEIKHDRFIDAYVKSIDYYQYMSETSSRQILTNPKDAKENLLFAENQKLPREIDRLFKEVGYPQQSDAHNKINDRVLTLPIFKDVITNFSKTLEQEVGKNPDTFQPKMIGKN